MNQEIESENRIVAFDDHTIRRVFHNNEWWYVIVDVIAALTNSKDPAGYLKDMRRRDAELGKGGGAICHPPFHTDKRWASKT